MIGFPGFALVIYCIWKLFTTRDCVQHIFAGSRQLQRHYESSDLPGWKSRKEVIMHLLHMRRMLVEEVVIA